MMGRRTVLPVSRNDGYTLISNSPEKDIDFFIRKMEDATLCLNA
jgi:hypothetical protein